MARTIILISDLIKDTLLYEETIRRIHFIKINEENT